MPNRVNILKQRFTQSVGLPFAKVLPASDIEQVLNEEGVRYRNRLWSPMVTIWAFLSQILDSDKSLHNCVSRVIVWLASAGETLPSDDTGAYSKARKRLPERVCKRLFSKSAAHLEQQVPPEALWCGHRVRICDGSSSLMSDTPANQKAYPQHSNQKPGCGFPIARLVVMFSLVTGAATLLMMAPLSTSEIVMARQLYAMLQPGDVIVADQAYGTYVDLVLAQQRGADAVFRRHHRRNSDFRKGKRLGIGDHIVRWYKPKQRPRHMSEAEFAALPESVLVREVHCLIRQPGVRTKEVIVVTTLVDPKRYRKSKLAELYRHRWEGEVNLKHVKTTLAMEMLRSKSPEMVRKEIYMHLLAYNLLRTLMWQAALKAGVEPLRVSLQGARQHLGNFIGELKDATAKQLKRLYQQLLDIVTHKLVPKRPHRIEPRVKKRRPKAFPRMQKPRAQLKAKLAA